MAETFAQELQFGPWASGVGTESTGKQRRLIQPATVGYLDWRVLCLTTDGGAFGVAELAMATSPGGANVALGQTFSDSTHFDGSSTAAAAFDGNLGTNYSSTAGGAGNWVRVTFSSLKNIVELKITARADAPNQAQGEVLWSPQEGPQTALIQCPCFRSLLRRRAWRG
jgi:hypothetical protein